MALVLKHRLVRHHFIMKICLLIFILVLISLMIQANMIHRRGLVLRIPHQNNKFDEYVDEFNADTVDLSWRPIPDTADLSSTKSANSADIYKSASEWMSRGDNFTASYNQPSSPSHARSLLTLFTTMKNDKNRKEIHEKTIANWAALRPYVNPILFVERSTDLAWIQKAQQSGWQIRNVTHWNGGIPVLKNMFIRITNEFSSTFYGFANADILFDRTLIANLKAFASYEWKIRKLFLIGKRTNVNSSDPVFRRLDASNLTSLSFFTKSNGSMFVTYAQDYFITTRFGFPWRRIPNFVVGRAGYDNWLVVMAQQWNLTVVDASYTLTAIHQMGVDGNRAGWAEMHHRCINRELVGIFDYKKGHTKCVPYISYIDLSGQIKIFRRPNIARDCF